MKGSSYVKSKKQEIMITFIYHPTKMLANSKNHIDLRDLKHYLIDVVIFVVIPTITDHVEEVKTLLSNYGIDPLVGWVAIAMALWLARRYISPQVLETNTTTTTATLEVTEPMQETLSPDTTTNEWTKEE